jgi:hypothetical protein
MKPPFPSAIALLDASVFLPDVDAGLANQGSPFEGFGL